MASICLRGREGIVQQGNMVASYFITVDKRIKMNIINI